MYTWIWAAVLQDLEAIPQTLEEILKGSIKVDATLDLLKTKKTEEATAWLTCNDMCVSSL